MPAASWSVLQEYESQFDTALAGVLAPFGAAPYSFALFPQLAVASLTTPRVEYQFKLGAPMGPNGEIQLRAKSGLAARPVAFHFSLRFVFVTDRTKLTAGQSGFRGALRDLLAPPAPSGEGAFTLQLLPYLCVTALGESMARRGFLATEEKAKLLDVWESEWDGAFSIRPEAMPD